MDLKEIKTLWERSIAEITQADAQSSLEALRVKYLGRKEGEITRRLRALSALSIGQKKKLGPVLQEWRQNMETILEERLRDISKSAIVQKIDLTAPGKKVERGHLHPLTLAEREIKKIFMGMNFSVVDGPEVESDYFNFEALNFPSDHPARDAQDTFWIKQSADDDASSKTRLLLRTQVTATQIHHLASHEPPFAILYPGRTFRNESIDAGHEANFYQAECMVVGRNITLANFKFVVEAFFEKFFVGQNIEFRYRPSYFPFVEPGLEVDIKLKGKWFEVMGAGMVHPRVFEYAHRNPRDWQGFAFGMGLDRLTMIKYQIPDIRFFYEGDLRFIRQF